MRQSHDQLAKDYVAGLLEYLECKVNIQHQLRGEVSYVDLSSEPSATAFPSAKALELGPFGKIAAKPCLMEFFSRQPTKVEIRSCFAKLFLYHGELLRQARRQKRRLTESALPHLWILTASASPSFLRSLEGKVRPEWGDGIYFLCSQVQKSAMIVIDELPKTPETLWLRLLGRGPTQRQAAEELSQSPESPLRDYLLELIHRYYLELKLKTTLTPADKELLMNISPAYLQARQRVVQEGIQQGILQGIQQGRNEGRNEGQRVFVEQLLKSRFGQLDNTLSHVMEGVMQLPPEEVVPLLLQASRDELVAKFNEKERAS